MTIGAMSREVWSTTSTVIVTQPTAVRAARGLLDGLLSDVDRVASRFRSDSEIAALNRCSGKEQTLSPLLDALVSTALQVARSTDGLVDPTVGAAVFELGYDRDFRALDVRGISRLSGLTGGRALPTPGHGAIRHDPATRRLLAPVGTWLDLGATAKAWTADRAAERIHDALGCGVLVNLGGDIAVAGATPAGGWRIAVGDDHRTAQQDGPVVSITAGGLATSSTSARRWRTAGGTRHHIVDPRTGVNPPAVWRTVSAVAGSAVEANAAATASIVLGRAAPAWLERRAVPARLVADTGAVQYVSAWPIDRMSGVA